MLFTAARRGLPRSSCRGRCVCPSGHEQRALAKAGWACLPKPRRRQVPEHVCAKVPHRQFVFPLPKRRRIYFRFERGLRGELCRARHER